MFGRIILGILMMVVGGSIVYFSNQIVEFIGRSARADEHLGGTRNAVMLLGLLLFIVGGLVMFGIVQISNPVDSVSMGI